MTTTNHQQDLHDRLSNERGAGRVSPDTALLEHTLAALRTSVRPGAAGRSKPSWNGRLRIALATVSGAAAGFLLVAQLRTLSGSGSSQPAGGNSVQSETRTAQPQRSASAAISASLQFLPASGHDLAQVATAPIRKTSDTLLAAREWSLPLQAPVTARP